MQCTNCNGNKTVATEVTCSVCGGWGYTETQEDCTSCDGYGSVDGESCTPCGGSGHIIVRNDCDKTIEQQENCQLCGGTGEIADPAAGISGNTFGNDGAFYCRFFDSSNTEIACSGGYPSEDACASAAASAGAHGYAWTMKPCGS